MMYLSSVKCIEPTSSSATSSFFFCLHLRAWNLFLPFLRIFLNIVQCWNIPYLTKLITSIYLNENLEHSLSSTMSSPAALLLLHAQLLDDVPEGGHGGVDHLLRREEEVLGPQLQ